MKKERRLLVSYSGGETSAFMTLWIKENWASEYDVIKVVFANTGQENEETLEFVDRCDLMLGFNTVWVEAVVDQRVRKGTRHKVVDFQTANRNGDVFEDMIKKYGIPNQNYPHCTRELKLHPITDYVRSIGWGPGTYDTAIGIRVDEIDRMSKKKDEFRFRYPLVSATPMTKPDINTWWSKQPFRLELKGYQGNCKWCWKKTLRKHLTLIDEDVSTYDFPTRMERLYRYAGRSKDNSPRVFFREGRDTDALLLESLREFEPFHDDAQVFNYDPELDAPGGGCTESCETFSDETMDQLHYDGPKIPDLDYTVE